MLSSLILTASLYGLGVLPEDIDRLQEETIKEVKLSEVKDGLYHGSCSYGVVTCSVEVVVKNHEITDINVLKGGSSSYAKRGEEVLKRVLAKQSLQVDAISGATVTSKAYLKAVEDALTGERKELDDD